MYAWTIIFLVALFAFDRGMGKRFPKFYRCIQLPVNIIVSVLATAYCALLIYALHEVLNSGVSSGDKLFFASLVLASLGGLCLYDGKPLAAVAERTERGWGWSLKG